MAKIGIFAGTFDPIHNGHIAYAQQAIAVCNLHKVVFVPEPQPRSKAHVSELSHRLAMLTLVSKNNPQFEILELDDAQFTVAKTLPVLKSLYKNYQLAMLVGSDVAAKIAAWPDVKELFASTEIIVGLRAGDQKPSLPVAATFLSGPRASVAARAVRQGDFSGVPPAVRDYIFANHLYDV